MVKRPLRRLAVLALIALLLPLTGCSTGRYRPGRAEDLPFPRASEALPAPKAQWRHHLDGRLTDLSVASDAGRVLVAEVLESISGNRTQLSLFAPSGARLWRATLDSPVRAQAISSAGDTVVVSTYQEELVRLDSKSGETLWKVGGTGMCRPAILEKSSKVLCHHDDDASPGLVFQVFDLDGKKVLDQKAPWDPLLLEVSRDESRILVGFTQGRLWMLDGKFKKLWEAQVDGELVDAAIPSPSAGASPIEAAILYNRKDGGQSLATLGAKGRRREDVREQIPLQQIEVTDDGSWVSAYGNGPRGQVVAQYDTDPKLAERWIHHSPTYADYNLKMDLLPPWTILGFENIQDRTRFSQVVALNRTGTMPLHLPLATEEGAYLYSSGISRASRLLVVGTDDGSVTAYRLSIP